MVILKSVDMRYVAMGVSLVVAVLMLLGKMAAYWLTGSYAILSDAAESVVHLLATGFAAFSLWYSTQLPDRLHPYGHGKIAYFSAGFEGALIGAAALMGLPFFNGFWSKEILLETALEQNPAVFLALLLGAALTAFYAVRMCWLVFFRQPEAAAATSHAHADGHAQVSPFMVGPLLVLAAGACLAWLVAEPFARWLATTLPFHAPYLLPHWPIDEVISLHTATSIATAIVMTVIVLSALLWAWTERRTAGRSAVSRAIEATEAFFNGSATVVAGATRGTAALLQKTQTGQLNWNLVGLALFAMAMLLLVLLGVI